MSPNATELRARNRKVSNKKKMKMKKKRKRRDSDLEQPPPTPPPQQKQPPTTTPPDLLPPLTPFNLPSLAFNKIRTLKGPSSDPASFQLPFNIFTSKCWILTDLRDLKHRLNTTKSRLDDFPLDPWHSHTRRMNTAGNVIPTVREMFNPEYCSQAWCKFYEILSRFPKLIPTKDTTSLLFSVHLCEAPGAFISALNHFLAIRRSDLKWTFLATTLNPYHESNDTSTMINEDRLILNSTSNWTFLKDKTGNLMNRDNLDYLTQLAKDKVADFFRDNSDKQSTSPNPNPKILLVTADGSIDCQTQPLDQESVVAELQFTEIVAALEILSEGGCFVLKIFTFFECKTVNHLYFLGAVFGEVHLYKPCTSKEGNSEVYVICLNYLGRKRIHRQLNFMKSQVGVRFPLSNRCSLVPLKFLLKSGRFAEEGVFMKRIYEAARFFTEWQTSIITRNISTFHELNPRNPNEIYFHYDILRSEIANQWIEKCRLEVLPSGKALFFGRRNFNPYQQHQHQQRKRRTPNNNYPTTHHQTHLDPRRELGTFNDKLRLLQSTDLPGKIQEIKRNLQFYKKYFQQNNKNPNNWTLTELNLLNPPEKLSIEYGKPYKDIASSRFCFGKLLKLRLDVLRGGGLLVRKGGGVGVNGRKSVVESCGCSWENKFIKRCFGEVLADVENNSSSWTLHTLCFKPLPEVETLLESTDMERTLTGLKLLLLKLTEMKPDESIFLCTYPLLSRLQLGVVVLVGARFFEMTILADSSSSSYSSPPPNPPPKPKKKTPPPPPSGLLLHRFKGVTSKQDAELLLNLAKTVVEIRGKLLAGGIDSVILEVVPVQVLINGLVGLDAVLRYNVGAVVGEVGAVLEGL